MVRSPLLAVFLIAAPLTALPAWAEQPVNLLPPSPVQEQEAAPQVPAADKPLLEEPSPSFQPIRPAEQGAEQTTPAPEAQPQPQPQIQPPQEQHPKPPVVVAPAMESAAPAVAEPVPVHVPPVGLPGWAVGVLVLAGAFLAGLFGILTAAQMRRAEMRDRRRAVAATLATELETRRLAFDSVPLPPNAEAGVSFVSSVTSLAGIDAGFRSVQGQIHLLPEKLAAHVSVHYAAVQRVSDFVKGQSLAAAVRMLQANRLGGHPCPDAGAMRDAHEELGAAFRGVEKLVQGLRAPR